MIAPTTAEYVALWLFVSASAVTSYAVVKSALSDEPRKVRLIFFGPMMGAFVGLIASAILIGCGIEEKTEKPKDDMSFSQENKALRQAGNHDSRQFKALVIVCAVFGGCGGWKWKWQ